MDNGLIAARYELHEQLGESTWRATDTELGREVVLRRGEPRALGAATLQHPHIVRMFDQGEADGQRYSVLEYVPGGTLADRAPEDLTADAAQTTAQSVAGALAYAH